MCVYMKKYGNASKLMSVQKYKRDVWQLMLFLYVWVGFYVVHFSANSVIYSAISRENSLETNTSRVVIYIELNILHNEYAEY